MKNGIVLLFVIVFFPLRLNSQIELKIGNIYPKDNEASIAAEKFLELVDRYSNGKIKVKVFSEERLGGDAGVLEAVRSGALDASVTGMLPINQYAKEYGFLNFPFVIKDFAHFKRIWESSLGRSAKELLIKNNLRPIGIYYRGFRLITSSKEIKNVSGMKNLKIRVPQNSEWDKIYKAFESIPFVIPLPELYKALKAGIVESSEGPASQINSYKLYEVQKYLVLSEHHLSIGIMCFSENTYKKLNEEQKIIIEKAASDASEAASDYALNSEKEIIKKLALTDMHLIVPDKESFRKKARKVIDALFKTEWTVTTFEEVDKM